MQRASYPTKRSAAFAYPSGDATKNDALLIDVIFVATYKGTYKNNHPSLVIKLFWYYSTPHSAIEMENATNYYKFVHNLWRKDSASVNG